MNVLVLSPRPEQLLPAFLQTNDTIQVSMDAPEDWPEADYVVSYGYRRVVKEPYLSKYQGRLLNIHLGYLPWNKGADPNFWSWFDGTPKGVTIHLMDEGIDTGPVVGRCLITDKPEVATLKTTYEALTLVASGLFFEVWPVMRSGGIRAFPQMSDGTFHFAKEREPFWAQLPLGYDTPVEDIEKLGEKARMDGTAIGGVS